MINYVFKSFSTVQICDVSYIHLQTDRTILSDTLIGRHSGDRQTDRKAGNQAGRQAGRQRDRQVNTPID